MDDATIDEHLIVEAYEVDAKTGDLVPVYKKGVVVPKQSDEFAGMTRGQIMAMMKHLGRALEARDRLIDKYGEDREDGAVIRFVKWFPGHRPDALELLPSGSPNATMARKYGYAAIRLNGKWFVTGSTQRGVAYEWEELLDFLDEGGGEPVDAIEVWPPQVVMSELQMNEPKVDPE